MMNMGRILSCHPLAETWECSTHPDGVSTVCCGTFDKMELTAVIKAHPEYLGERHKSDVLKFLLEDNCSLVVRPSGTEPKLKIYISVSAENKEMAEEVEDEIAKTAEKWIC